MTEHEHTLDPNSNPPLILASGSPRRKEIIATLRIPFQVIKSEIDETHQEGETPEAYARRLSIEKGETVYKMVRRVAPDTTLILSADTIVIAENGDIIGKPTDADDACAILQRLRKRKHTVCTAISLFRIMNKEATRLTRLTKSAVYMRDYSDAEIDAYIASGEPFDKAGAYGIQSETFRPVSKIEGSYSNVVGLPVETLIAMIRGAGWREI